MARGFGSGFVWGVLAGLAGAAALSLAASMREPPEPQAGAVEVPPGSEFAGRREDRPIVIRPVEDESVAREVAPVPAPERDEAARLEEIDRSPATVPAAGAPEQTLDPGQAAAEVEPPRTPPAGEEALPGARSAGGLAAAEAPEEPVEIRDIPAEPAEVASQTPQIAEPEAEPAAGADALAGPELAPAPGAPLASGFVAAAPPAPGADTPLLDQRSARVTVDVTTPAPLLPEAGGTETDTGLAVPGAAAEAPEIVASAAPGALPEIGHESAPEPVAAPAPLPEPAAPRAGEEPRSTPQIALPEAAPEAAQPETPGPSPEASAEAAPEAEPSDEGAAATAEAEAAPEDTRPIARYAEPVEVPDGAPRLAIVLIDDGAFSAAPDMLIDFPVPVSVAIDPAREGAEALMRRYRDMGIEVLALVSLPQYVAADAADEVLGEAAAAVPEAVGFLEAAEGALQRDARSAEKVVAAVGESGHGLVLWPKGLNTALALAEREGVPAAVAERRIEGEGGRMSAIRRVLDQATFDARRDGASVVVGHLVPETVTSLLIWASRERSDDVVLVPVSMVLDRKENGR